MRCPNCERENAARARFCDACGAALPLAEDALETNATGPITHLNESLSMPPAPSEPASISTAGPPRDRWRELNGGLWLIGLGVLFLTGTFWPGILILVGLSAYLEERTRGRRQYAVRTLLFPLGLALLFWTHWFWPGILILLGVLALISPEIRPSLAGRVS